MMAYPYDDARLILALQIDHSRVAGYLAAHWGNREFSRPEPYASVVKSTARSALAAFDSRAADRTELRFRVFNVGAWRRR